jgi:hypothetical protein
MKHHTLVPAVLIGAIKARLQYSVVCTAGSESLHCCTYCHGIWHAWY